jgi:hypothetical protein
MVFTCFYNGPVDVTATMIFQPLIQLGPAVNTLGVMPYAEAMNLTSWLTPHGDRYYHEGGIVQSQAHAMEVLEAAMLAVRKSARVSVSFDDHGAGVVGGVDAHAMAFPHRTPMMSVTVGAHWTDVEDDATSVTSVQAVIRQLDAAGCLTENCHLSGFVDKVDEVKAWGTQNTKKLAELRSEYDPAMVLMVNHPQ